MTFAVLLITLLLGAGDFEASALQDAREEVAAVDARPVPPSLVAARDESAYRQARGGRQGPSWMDRLFIWLSNHVVEPLLSSVPASVVRIGLYVLLGAVLLFAIYQLTRGERPSAIARRVRADLDGALAEEGIEAVDLEGWLERALAEGRHREAVRLYYLLALRSLSERGEVAWAPEKTNSAYVRELRSGTLRNHFETFTRMFDRIWYGSEVAGPTEVTEARDYSGRLQAVLQQSGSGR